MEHFDLYRIKKNRVEKKQRDGKKCKSTYFVKSSVKEQKIKGEFLIQ